MVGRFRHAAVSIVVGVLAAGLGTQLASAVAVDTPTGPRVSPNGGHTNMSTAIPANLAGIVSSIAGLVPQKHGMRHRSDRDGAGSDSPSPADPGEPLQQAEVR